MLRAWHVSDILQEVDICQGIDLDLNYAGIGLHFVSKIALILTTVPKVLMLMSMPLTAKLCCWANVKSLVDKRISLIFSESLVGVMYCSFFVQIIVLVLKVIGNHPTFSLSTFWIIVFSFDLLCMRKAIGPSLMLPAGVSAIMRDNIGWYVDTLFDDFLACCIAIQLYDIMHISTFAHIVDNVCRQFIHDLLSYFFSPHTNHCRYSSPVPLRLSLEWWQKWSVVERHQYPRANLSQSNLRPLLWILGRLWSIQAPHRCLLLWLLCRLCSIRQYCFRYPFFINRYGFCRGGEEAVGSYLKGHPFRILASYFLVGAVTASGGGPLSPTDPVWNCLWREYDGHDGHHTCHTC